MKRKSALKQENFCLTFFNELENRKLITARELHDTIGQLIAASKLKLELFKYEKEISPERIDEVLSLLLITGKEISKLSREIYPPEINKYPFHQVLTNYFVKLEKKFPNKKIEFNFPVSIKFSTMKLLPVYRLIEEFSVLITTSEVVSYLKTELVLEKKKSVLKILIRGGKSLSWLNKAISRNKFIEILLYVLNTSMISTVISPRETKIEVELYGN
ncbi:MAG: histidine kinase [Ignavibacteriaceae bacterium]|nr:histidine kinase [Ignavibacteriaceae bacterium]